jgi:hypothetical protein
MAAGRLTQAATADQIAAVRKVLADTRRAISRILAEDDTDD